MNVDRNDITLMEVAMKNGHVGSVGRRRGKWWDLTVPPKGALKKRVRARTYYDWNEIVPKGERWGGRMAPQSKAELFRALYALNLWQYLDRRLKCPDEVDEFALMYGCEPPLLFSLSPPPEAIAQTPLSTSLEQLPPIPPLSPISPEDWVAASNSYYAALYEFVRGAMIGKTIEMLEDVAERRGARWR